MAFPAAVGLLPLAAVALLARVMSGTLVVRKCSKSRSRSVFRGYSLRISRGMALAIKTDRGMNMTNENRELDVGELDAIVGGNGYIDGVNVITIFHFNIDARYLGVSTGAWKSVLALTPPPRATSN
jgi:hypothetical protein